MESSVTSVQQHHQSYVTSINEAQFHGARILFFKAGKQESIDEQEVHCWTWCKLPQVFASPLDKQFILHVFCSHFVGN